MFDSEAAHHVFIVACSVMWVIFRQNPIVYVVCVYPVLQECHCHRLRRSGLQGNCSCELGEAISGSEDMLVAKFGLLYETKEVKRNESVARSWGKA